MKGNLDDLLQTGVDGHKIGVDVPLLEVFQSVLHRRISEELTEIAGDGTVLRLVPGGDCQLQTTAIFLSDRPTTIIRGSTVMMRTMLGLPS